MLSKEKMIAICRVNDASFDGIFFMAVKTTGIYCIASCPARFPKEDHITFYHSREKAEQAGYRGCLRCHSAERNFQPQWISRLVIYLHNHLEESLTMEDLSRRVGRHRSTVTRNFQHYYGCTPMEYLRELKMKAARSRIREGKEYRDVAFSLGYASISGFRSAFKQYYNTTPGNLEANS